MNVITLNKTVRIPMLRLGLCCKFSKEDIKFKEIRYTYFKTLSKGEQAQKLDDVIAHNLQALKAAIDFCMNNQIYAFRVGSFLFPLLTHPEIEFKLKDLKSADLFFDQMAQIKKEAEQSNIRLSFHPDQFVILNSPNDRIVEAAIKDLEFHNQMADWIGADVINIHAGGVYGDKSVALKRLEKNIERLSKGVRQKLTFENDDKSYTPQDLWALCMRTNIPLVYDVHHHRCLPDTWGENEATKQALKTWDREPLFHLSSPKEGWQGPKPARHHDYIHLDDFPSLWKEIRPLTVDVEAKAKELAVLQLMREMKSLSFEA